MAEGVSIWRQFRLFITYGLRLEFSSKEKIISPVLFAAVILILGTICFADNNSPRVLVAEIYLALFLAIQISCLRVFEFEQHNGVLELLQTYPVSSEIWFSAKLVVFMLSGLTIMLPTLLLAFLFHAQSGYQSFFFILGISSLVLVGLSALGVLLTAMMLQATARHILYPIIYFPLLTPVLIAAAETSISYLEHGQINEAQMKWITLLLGFDIVYLTLGILLFGELVEN